MRRTLVLLLLLVTTLGCSSLGRDPDAGLRAGPGAGRTADAVAVRSAAEATRAAGGADITVAAQGPARGRLVQTTGSGQVDFARRGTRLELAVDELGGVRARVRDDQAYAALPAGAIGDIARGRGWVSVDLSAVDPGLYADTVVQLGTGVTGNLADVPVLLSAIADRDAVLIGPDDVEGTPAVRYRVTLDLARVAATRPELEAVLARYRADTGAASMTGEVWVGTDGRLVRVAQLLAGPGATSTVTFADLGPRAEVAAPDARRVTDLLVSLTGR